MITEHEEKWLEWIDSSVETASDDELFAGGYLRGHISLSAAACEQEGVEDIALFQEKVDSSLEKAKSELSPADRIIVNDLWLNLKNT